MRRVLYVAGINRKHLAAAADSCPYWLLSVSLMPRTGPPSWLWSMLQNRRVLWDPGTFSDDARSFRHYREWLDRYARPEDRYLSYDEIGGDPWLNEAYLIDLNRRGYHPIPIYHRGMSYTYLFGRELALGGLVPMSNQERQAHLDETIYRHMMARTLLDATCTRIHLLGVSDPYWFRRYPASSGDSTTWIPRFPWNRSRPPADWLKGYGDQEIPYVPPAAVQDRFAV